MRGGDRRRARRTGEADRLDVVRVELARHIDAMLKLWARICAMQAQVTTRPGLGLLIMTTRVYVKMFEKTLAEIEGLIRQLEKEREARRRRDSDGKERRA